MRTDKKEVARLIKILILSFEEFSSDIRITKLKNLKIMLEQHVELINSTVKMLEKFE